MGLDDALDAAGVHGVGGIVGTICTGIFADNDENLGYPGALNASMEAGRKQVGYQFAAVCIVFRKLRPHTDAASTYIDDACVYVYVH